MFSRLYEFSTIRLGCQFVVSMVFLFLLYGKTSRAPYRHTSLLYDKINQYYLVYDMLKGSWEDLCIMDNEQELRIAGLIAMVLSETYRFNRTLDKAIKKLDMNDQKKIVNQYSWFSRKIDDLIKEIGMRMITYDNVLYDVGMPITPINIDEFGSDDRLLILYTIEPTIMQGDRVFKTGTVILGKDE